MLKRNRTNERKQKTNIDNINKAIIMGFGSSVKLRDLIRSIRNCKTAAEERELIAKESAEIRTQLKDEDSPYRARNVAKLMFIHTLGYSTHFGQMECVKLITSQKYPEKRIGYLGLMVLLDERQEVLTLIENTLAKDLKDKNQFVQALALTAIANISSADIARDLSGEIEKLLFNANPYIRKKAALCAVRIFRKVPDLIDNFVEKLSGLLNDRNHGALMTAITLITEAVTANPQHINLFRKFVPKIVRMIRALLVSTNSLEHDISGMPDPFLQIKILRLFRILGKGDKKVSDAMNDALAQVATNTEGNRNSGNAILYECVLTIMGIESESGLRVLAINILGRFLTNRDNNIRYIALNTLAKVVDRDTQAVQRHRTTVIECLKDPDISIRKRALDLIYCLVNESNIRLLVPELLNYLQNNMDSEFREDFISKICTVVDKFSPTKEWQIDIMIRIFTQAGKCVREEIAASLIAVITQSPDLQAYAVKKLYAALQDSDSTMPDMLIQVAVWCIGEYGELLTAEKVAQESQIIDILYKMMESSYLSFATKGYILTAFVKLSQRFESSAERLKGIISAYRTSLELEIQQRSCEFTNLLQWKSILPEILEHMPPIERASAPAGQPTSHLQPLPMTSNDATSGEEPIAAESTPTALPSVQPAVPPQPEPPAPAAPTALIDLDSLLTIPTTPSNGIAPASSVPQASTSVPPSNLLIDLLESAPVTELLRSVVVPTAQAFVPPGVSMPNFGPAFPAMVVFDKHGLSITFNFSKPQPEDLSVTHITASFRNKQNAQISDLNLQIAVPKYMKLLLSPPSSTVVPPLYSQGDVVQSIRITNSNHGQKPILMKIKVDFKINGVPMEEQAQISGFPAGL